MIPPRSDSAALTGVNHLTVRSADFVGSERFYCELLGLRPGPRPPFTVPGRWFYLGQRALVHVLPPHAGDAGAAPGCSGFDHVALDAVGLAGFEHRLRAAAQPYKLGRQPGAGDWQLFVLDPDGLSLELAFAAKEQPAGP